jgi:hypothetical protein
MALKIALSTSGKYFVCLTRSLAQAITACMAVSSLTALISTYRCSGVRVSLSLILANYAEPYIGLSYVPELATDLKQDNTRPYLWYTSVSPSFGCTYPRFFRSKPRSVQHKNLEINKTKGKVSKSACKKIKNCFTWLLIISPLKIVFSKKENKKFTFKINFITLTLSGKQVHTDQYIKQHMLQPFLKWMKHNHKATSYIWKAEAQKNGNIHFHITTNKFIHWRAIRMKWNSLQQNHGYTCTQDVSNPITDINSTDVHAVKNSKQIAMYMLKYFSKSEIGKRPIDGMLWQASSNLNQSSLVIEETEEEFNQLHECMSLYDLATDYKKDFCTVHIWNKKILRVMPDVIKENFKTRIDTLIKNDCFQRYFETETFY